MLDLWKLPPIKRHEEEVEVTDSRQPDVRITLRLRELDVAGMALAMERADEMTREYVTGDEETETRPVAYPFLGEPIALSARLFQNLCLIEAMQVGEERYDLDGLMGLAARLPDGYSRLVMRVRQINKGARKRSPNSPGADGGPSSDPPSTSGNGIQGSNPGKPLSGIPITSPCEASASG